MRNKRNKNIPGILKIIIPAAAIVICLAAVFTVRYMPTGKTMSLYEYFDVRENSGEIIIFINNERSDYSGIIENNTLYVPQQLVQKELNQRFYMDAETNGILYADGNNMYTFMADSNEYADDTGKKYNSEAPVMINRNGQDYLDIEYVGTCSDIEYKSYESPSRLVIQSGNEVNRYVVAQKDIKVRYRGGVKSPVLEEAAKGDRLVYRKNVGDWVEVVTASGVTGYVQSSALSEGYEEERVSTYAEELASMRKDYSIALGWFQIAGTAGNSTIDSVLAGTSGITTISPTWYAISDSDGNMSSFASGDFVKNMHARGIEVWPLISDIEHEFDGKAFFSSRAARSRAIDTLISDAQRYGYDGINVDFERINKESGPDYLQFIRELSIQCRRNKLVLSIDNYKAEAYNSHYDMKEQGVFADYIILMGYDEHYSGSASGSVASIGFVEDGIKKALEYVSKEKIINAMPFYTRIWTEKDGTTTSRAVGMQTAIDDLNKNNAPAIWDETAGQYFGSYEKNGETIKIWVEEDRSIEEKLKLYEKYELAGVAAWKLGLEKKSVWSVISKYTR